MGFWSTSATPLDREGARRGAKPSKPGWGLWALLWLALAAVVALRAVAEGRDHPGPWMAAFWVVALAFLLLALWLSGWRLKRAFWGYAVSARNVVSLSRLQLAGWSLLFAGTALTAVLFGVVEPNRANVLGDPAVLGALGVSAGGLAGTAAVATGKAGSTPNPRRMLPHAKRMAERHREAYFKDAVEAAGSRRKAQVENRLAAASARIEGAKGKAARQADGQPSPLDQVAGLRQETGPDPDRLAKGLAKLADGADAAVAEDLARLPAGTLGGLDGEALKEFSEKWAGMDLLEGGHGSLYANQHPWEARLSDAFEGDELGNTADRDLGKLQLAFFTLLAMGAYCVAVWQAFATVPDPAAPLLPVHGVLPGELVTLLAGSHGANLVNKVAGHTPKL